MHDDIDKPFPGTPIDAQMQMPRLSDRDILSAQVLAAESKAWISYYPELPSELSSEVREALRETYRRGWRASSDYLFGQIDNLRWNSAER